MKPELIKKTGQEMYFDKKIAKKMIERENNSEHILVSKIFEAILIAESQNKKNLKVADLGAGAHPKRYIKFLKFLREKNGKLCWVDQSPYMLGYASKNTPKEFSGIFDYVEEEMTNFLKKTRESFDVLIFKYSFNYVIPQTLKSWMKIIYKSLKKSGKIVANLHFYEEGMRERSYNAIYKIGGKKIKPEYKPKDNEIIETQFLKKPGDESLNPEIFASTKIIYYTPKNIERFAREAGFSIVKIFKNWEKNNKWKSAFERLNPGLESKPKTFLLLKK